MLKNKILQKNSRGFIYFVNTELQFSPGQLLFSSPTDFMIYSMFQILTKHLAGAMFPIYCWEHLKKIQQKFLTQHSPDKKRKKLVIVLFQVSPTKTYLHFQILLFLHLGLNYTARLPCCGNRMWRRQWRKSILAFVSHLSS